MNDPLSCTLAQLLALPATEAQTVLDAWVAAKNPALPTEAAASDSKPHAKLAKAALYKLKSSGVALPAAPAPKPAEAPAPKAEDPGLEGILSSVLGTGDRAVFFARTVRGGGVEVFQAVINDETGLMQLERTESNRAKYRERLETVRADGELAVLFVPFARIHEELCRAYALNAKAGTFLGEEAQRNVARLAIEPLAEPRPIPAPEPADAALLPLAEKLHEEPELAQWMPGKAPLEVLNLALEATRAKNLGDDEERRVQLADARSAAEAHFTSDTRKRYAQRLWLQAEVFEVNDRSGAAATARAEARHLFHSQQPSRFAEGLFTKVLALQRPKPPPPAPVLEPRPSRPPPVGLAPPPPMPPPRKK